MSGGSLLSLILFASSSVSMLVLFELVARRIAARTREAARTGRSDSALVPLPPALIGAFLSLVGLLLLFPWATSLSSERETGLQTGIVFAVLLAVGLLHTLSRNASAR